MIYPNSNTPLIYCSASDVYAFGIIANEMFSLKLPFEDTEYTYLWQLEKKVSSPDGHLFVPPDRVFISSSLL